MKSRFISFQLSALKRISRTRVELELRSRILNSEPLSITATLISKLAASRSDHPFKYWPSSTLLNFGGRRRTGVSQTFKKMSLSIRCFSAESKSVCIDEYVRECICNHFFFINRRFFGKKKPLHLYQL